MNKILLMIVLIVFSFFSQAKEYTFSAIENLPTQAIAVRIMTEVYRQLGLDLKVELMPGLRAQQSAINGTVDGEISRIFAYGNQTPNVIRVPTSFYSLKTVAYIIKGSGVTIKGKSDLNRYRSAAVRGVKHTEKITKDVDSKKVNFLNSPESLMMFLNAGRAQVALTNPLEGALVIKKLGYENIERVASPLAELPLYHYIHKDHSDLVQLINQKLIKLKASGELDILAQKTEEEVINNWFK